VLQPIVVTVSAKPGDAKWISDIDRLLGRKFIAALPPRMRASADLLANLS
jgi:hypothetical protein